MMVLKIDSQCLFGTLELGFGFGFRCHSNAYICADVRFFIDFCLVPSFIVRYLFYTYPERHRLSGGFLASPD